MPRSPGKPYIESLSARTDFNRDSLEKVYRLLDLLQLISKAPDIEGKLALKGGTAIQFLYFEFQRLSVDIDFNYVGSLDRSFMLGERPRIERMFSRIFRERGYEFDPPRKWHSEEQFLLSYTNSSGNKDRVKVEINYSERLPIFPLSMQRLHHPFNDLGQVEFLSYELEEHMAMKTRALLTRGTPRDLFDIYLLSTRTTGFRFTQYRKLAILYLCLASGDVRRISASTIQSITGKDVKRNLVPLLRRREYRVDLEAMKMVATDLVEKVLTFEPDEMRFLNKFYDEREFDSRLLFEDLPVSPNLHEHPVIKWRLEGEGKNTMQE